MHTTKKIFKKITGILQKMKEGAENVQTKIQAKVESLKTVEGNAKGKYVCSLLEIEQLFKISERLTNICLLFV